MEAVDYRVGMLHANTRRAITSHGVADQATAQPVWNSPVMCVDVGHQIMRDELLEISSGHGT
jgi:hypothetical protein